VRSSPTLATTPYVPDPAQVLGNSSDLNQAVGYVAQGAASFSPIYNGTTTGWSGCTGSPQGLTMLRSSTRIYADLVRPTVAGAFAMPATLNALMSLVPFYIKQLVWNSAASRFWAAVPTGATAADGGLYSGTSLTAGAIAVAATFKVTGIALSADESTVYFSTRAPLHAVYSIPSTCTSACVPALVYTAALNTELRGIALAPQPRVPATPTASPAASAAASPSLSATVSATLLPPASATRTPSPSPMVSQLGVAPALFFGAASVVVLRVGDGSAALTTGTAPLFLDEYAPSGPNGTWVSVQNAPVSGVTLSGTDYTQGAFSRAADQASLVLAGVAAPAGTAPLAAVPWFSADRVIASLDRSGLTTLTPVAASVFDGLIKGVCTFDGTAFWFAGNTTTPIGIGYVARGAAPTAATSVVSLTGVKDFTACAATFNGGLVALRSQPSSKTVFYDYSHDAAGGGPIALVSGTANVGGNPLSDQSSYAKAVVTNLASTRSWVAAVGGVPGLLGISIDGGIHVGATFSTSGFTLAVAITYKVTGLALSPNEAMLFFTARAPKHALYSVLASCSTGCAVTQLALAATNTEFRGLAPAPQPFVPFPSPSPTPSSSPLPLCAANYIRVNGTCAACGAGFFSAGGAATACVNCAAGSSSVAGGSCVKCAEGSFAVAGAAACTPCAVGSHAPAGAAACTACPTTAGYFPAGNTQTGRSACACVEGSGWSSPGGSTGGPVGLPSPPYACAACPAGSSNAVNGSITCTCAASGASWAALGNSCGCTGAGLTSRGTSGAALVCSACSTSCSAPGTFRSGPCTATEDLACSMCAQCGDGEFVVQACGAASNTVCGECGGDTYASAGDAACTSCGAGSAPDAAHSRCVCADANAVWTKASNTCACSYGYTGSGSGATLTCAVDPTAVTRTPTSSATPSKTPSISVSPTASFSTGASQSVTPSITASMSLTGSNTRTPSVTPTPTRSAVSPSTVPVASPSPATASSPSTQGTPGPSPSYLPPSASPAASSTPTASASVGSGNLGGAAAGAAPAAAGSAVATIAAAVGGVVVAVVAATLYARKRRANSSAATLKGGVRAGGLREGGADAAAPVVVSSPLGAGAGSGARASRAAFSPAAAGRAGSAVPTSSWTRCTRIATGQVYYHNTVSGETQWVLPVGGVVVGEVSQ